MPGRQCAQICLSMPQEKLPFPRNHGFVRTFLHFCNDLKKKEFRMGHFWSRLAAARSNSSCTAICGCLSVHGPPPTNLPPPHKKQQLISEQLTAAIFQQLSFSEKKLFPSNIFSPENDCFFTLAVFAIFGCFIPFQ